MDQQIENETVLRENLEQRNSIERGSKTLCLSNFAIIST